MIDIDILDSRRTFRSFQLQIDSGAVVSLMRRSVAHFLGLELPQGRQIKLGAVVSIPVLAYVHEIEMRIGESPPFPAPIALADTDHVPNLLGRQGVFDRFEIIFDPSQRETRFRFAEQAGGHE